MSKKMMLLALAVACAAVFALPAAASATTAHVSATTSISSVGGAGGTLTSTSGSSVVCTGTGGSGKFSTTTEGVVSLKFTGCKSSGFNCSNTGVAGEIEVTNSFDLIMVSPGASTGKAGILLTPTGSTTLTSTSPELAAKVFYTEFTCLGFISIKVYGNGVIGTFEQSCNTNAAAYSVEFSSSVKGTQADLSWTGVPYDLINTQSSHPTSSLDGTASLTLPAARQLLCT